MIDFIQVGDYKTGTTWLQKYFYPIHSEINYLGGPFQNNELEHLLHLMIDSRDLDFNNIKIHNKILQLLKNSKDIKTGICREVFSCTNFISGENARRNAERLFKIFGKVKIIFIIREQISMIQSIYSTYLKTGGTLPLNKFIFDPIISRGLVERVKWHKQIQMYFDIFGKDNVHVGIFEQFKYDKQAFLNEICKHLEIQPFQLINDEITLNKGLTTYGALVSRIGNRFFRSYYNNSNINTISAKIINLFTSKKKLNHLIKDTEKRIIPNYGEYDLVQRKDYALNWRGVVLFRRIAENLTIGKPIKIPGDIAHFLKQSYKESNQLLLNHYKLPVDKYNYSL